MADKLSIKYLLDRGVHLGHKSKYWDPSIKHYIYGRRNDLHIIDLEKTLMSIRNACRFVKSTSYLGGSILFVTSEERYFNVLEKYAHYCDQPSLSGRWIGGLLTNFVSLKNIQLSKAEIRAETLRKFRMLNSMSSMNRLPSGLIVIGNSLSVVKEANVVGVPIVLIADTNTNIINADYIIPGNDDSIQSISTYLFLLSSSIKEGIELKNRI